MGNDNLIMGSKTGEKVKDLDFKKVQSQLITRIRGQKSQQQLNQQMSYKFNKVAKWENGTNKISWVEFLTLLKHQKIDVSPYFLKNFNYNADLKDAPSLIFHIAGQLPSDQLASSLGVSRSKIYRMFSNEAPFYLEDILKMIFLADNYFLDFIRIVAGEEPIEELRHFHEYIENQDIFFYFPEAALILGCLELGEYRNLKGHSSSFVSKKTKIEKSKVTEVISKLEAGGLIEKKDGKYSVLAKNTMLEKDQEQILENKLFWLKKYQKLMNQKLEELELQDSSLNDYGYLVTAVTPQAKMAIKKKISRFYQELTTILSSDLNREDDELNIQKKDVLLIHFGMLSLIDEDETSG